MDHVNVSSCKGCELLGRALVAIGAESPLWLFDRPERVIGVRSVLECLVFILELDEVEEESGELDLRLAAMEFRKKVDNFEASHVSFGDIESWIGQFVNFVWMERSVVPAGYELVDSDEWYKAKSVDVRWVAFQFLLLSGKSVPEAQRYLNSRMREFVLLEIYDDLIDQENIPLLRDKNLSAAVFLGQKAARLGRKTCQMLSSEIPKAKRITNHCSRRRALAFQTKRWATKETSSQVGKAHAGNSFAV